MLTAFYQTDDARALLIAPKALQAEFNVLHQLWQELIAIAERVTEPLSARVRLLWWRETVQLWSKGQDTHRHPLGAQLAAVLQRNPHILPAIVGLMDDAMHQLCIESCDNTQQWLQRQVMLRGALHQWWGILAGVEDAHQLALLKQLGGLWGAGVLLRHWQPWLMQRFAAMPRDVCGDAQAWRDRPHHAPVISAMQAARHTLVEQLLSHVVTLSLPSNALSSIHTIWYEWLSDDVSLLMRQQPIFLPAHGFGTVVRRWWRIIKRLFSQQR